MRVVGGSARGRRLKAPPGTGTRPITDRAKEAIFNMLEARMSLVDVTAVDLFAGSGSFGIEALSRGARHVTFVERNRAAAKVLAANLDALSFDDRATVLVSPVEVTLDRVGHVDVAFCDPPYAQDPWANLLARLQADVLVGHAETPVTLTDGWEEITRRSYGRAHVVLARRIDG